MTSKNKECGRPTGRARYHAITLSALIGAVLIQVGGGCDTTSDDGRLDVRTSSRPLSVSQVEVIDLDFDHPAVDTAFRAYISAAQTLGLPLEEELLVLGDLANIDQALVVATLRTSFDTSHPVADRYPILYTLARLPSQPACDWAVEYLTIDAPQLIQDALDLLAQEHDVGHDPEIERQGSIIEGFIEVAMACDEAGFETASDALITIGTSHPITIYRHMVGYNALWFASPSTRAETRQILQGAPDFDLLDVTPHEGPIIPPMPDEGGVDSDEVGPTYP